MRMAAPQFGLTFSDRSKSRFIHVLDGAAEGLSFNARRALDDFTKRSPTDVKGRLLDKQQNVEDLVEPGADPYEWNVLLQQCEMERLRTEHRMDCDMLSFWMACSAWDSLPGPFQDYILWDEFCDQLNVVWRRALRNSVHGLKSHSVSSQDSGLCANDFHFIQDKFFLPKRPKERAEASGYRLLSRTTSEGKRVGVEGKGEGKGAWTGEGAGTGDNEGIDNDMLRLASVTSCGSTEDGEVTVHRDQIPPDTAVGHKEFRDFWKWFRNVLWFVRKFGDMWAAGRVNMNANNRPLPKVMMGF